MRQILESALLNTLNFQTLIATLACRIRKICRDNFLLEFGLRRAQGTGANTGARAALIGGCHFSSNAGISHALGYPPKGTHAHSMVQAIMALGGDELSAFRAYADLYPDDCLLLVDTVNTLESGIPNAIKVFEYLRRKGHRPVGIRLDSGDLAQLSIQASIILDKAGFDQVSIVLSNQLDEMVIWQIMTQIRDEAPSTGVDPQKLIKRLVFGIGTNLITSKGHSALDGVYKLSALKRDDIWVPALKISETPGKTLNPGLKNVWRLYNKNGVAQADLITLHDEEPERTDTLSLHHPTGALKESVIDRSSLASIESLLENITINGDLVCNLPDIEDIRKRRIHDMERLGDDIRRMIDPRVYQVAISADLWNEKQRLIQETLDRSIP